MNKEKWINEVMESTAGMQRATPMPGLFDRIAVAAGRQVHTTIHIPSKKWIAAAILLVMLNIGSVLYAIGQHKHEQNTVASNTLFTEIQTGSTYNY